MAQARYCWCAASSSPIWPLRASTTRSVGMLAPRGGADSGGLRQLLLARLDQLALLDRIAVGQPTLLQHPDGTPFAPRLAHAALRLRLLRHVRRIRDQGLPYLTVTARDEPKVPASCLRSAP